MMCCVITRFHEMIGCDLHTADPTFPVPPYLPFTPHLVRAVARFGVWADAKDKESERVDTAAGPPLSKVFDIGKLIPHIGVNHIIPMGFLTLLSSSEGHFGVQSVQTEKGPIAVALALVANPQLNCNDFLPTPKLFPFPLPLPSGWLVAPNTVVAGLTLGDYLAGLFSMVATSGATLVMGIVTGGIVKFGLPIIGKFLRPVIDPLMMQLNNRMPSWLFSAVLEGRMNLGELLSSPNGQRLMDGAQGWLEDKATKPLTDFVKNKLQRGADSFGKGVDWIADPIGINDYFNDVALIPTYPLSHPLVTDLQAVPASWAEKEVAGWHDDVAALRMEREAKDPK